MALSNYDLQELAKILNFNVEVVLQDQLQDITPNTRNGKYIINLGTYENEGTHWVALQFKKNDAMYYDSYGSPPSEAIKAFVKRAKPKQFAYANVISQALESELCGWYCIAFLYWNLHSPERSIIDSTNDFSNSFSYNPDLNAGRIRTMFNKWLDKKKTPQRLFDLLFQKIKYK